MIEAYFALIYDNCKIAEKYEMYISIKSNRDTKQHEKIASLNGMV